MGNALASEDKAAKPIHQVRRSSCPGPGHIGGTVEKGALVPSIDVIIEDVIWPQSARRLHGKPLCVLSCDGREVERTLFYPSKQMSLSPIHVNTGVSLKFYKDKMAEDGDLEIGDIYIKASHLGRYGAPFYASMWLGICTKQGIAPSDQTLERALELSHQPESPKVMITLFTPDRKPRHVQEDTEPTCARVKSIDCVKPDVDGLLHHRENFFVDFYPSAGEQVRGLVKAIREKDFALKTLQADFFSQDMVPTLSTQKDHNRLVQPLEDQIRELRSLLQEAEEKGRDADIVKARVSQLEDLLDRGVKEKEGAKIGELEEDKRELSARLTRSEESKEKLEAQLSIAERDVALAQKRRAAVEAADRENAHLGAHGPRLLELEVHNKRLAEKLKNLQGGYASIANTEASNRELMLQKENLQARVLELEQGRTSEDDSEISARELRHANERLQSQVRELEAANEGVAVAYAKMAEIAPRQQATLLQHRNDELAKQVGEQSAEISNLSTQVGALTIRNRDLDTQLRTQETRRDELKDREISNLSTQNAALTAHNRDLDTQLRTQETRRDELKDRVALLQTEVSELDAANKSLRGKAPEANARIHELEMLLAGARRCALKLAGAEGVPLERATEEVLSRLAVMREDLGAEREIAKKQQGELASKVRKLNALEDEVEQLRESSQRRAGDLARAEAQLAAASQDLAEERAEHAAIQGRSVSEASESKHRHEELRKLQLALADERERCQQQGEELSRIMGRLETVSKESIYGKHRNKELEREVLAERARAEQLEQQQGGAMGRLETVKHEVLAERARAEQLEQEKGEELSRAMGRLETVKHEVLAERARAEQLEQELLSKRPLEKGEWKLLTVAEIGARVCRGPGWKWEEQDAGGLGTVIHPEVPTPSDWAWVCWDHGITGAYRIGAEGCFDLRREPQSEVQMERQRAETLERECDRLRSELLGKHLMEAAERSFTPKSEGSLGQALLQAADRGERLTCMTCAARLHGCSEVRQRSVTSPPL